MGIERSKVFSCPECLVDFEINVEPLKDDETVAKKYPKSVEWLKMNKMSCPACGSTLEEM
jgi:predicted RNA-binding Zn-ribbon protein involved in translation (DUF1610 family)